MLKPHLDVNRDGELLIGGLSTVEIADRFGTPLFVTDEERIRGKYRRFYKAFSDFWDDLQVMYAYKANSNLAVCKALQDEGCGADVASLCELKIALETGLEGKKITFNGNNKSREEIELGIKNGVLFNVDNFRELEIIEELATEMDEEARIGFRVNPNVEAPTHPHISTGLRKGKFGIDVQSGKALKAYEKASEMRNLKVESIHSHIGSQILDPDPFMEQARKVMEIREEVERETGVELETINLGGGLGIPYKSDEEELPPEVLAAKITSTIEERLSSQNLSEPNLILEPGRFLVADSTLLLGRVGHVKKKEESADWISIDGGMNVLIRPSLYGSYHHIELANKMNDEKNRTYNIAGPLCESGDYLGKGRSLPPAGRGDLIAVYDVGAYGISMANQYNAKPRPGMVTIKSSKIEMVRKGEKCEYVIRLDRIPTWLK